MKIESIRLKNFKTFRQLYLKNLPGLAFFVGPNASGKSTLFDIFCFLKDALKHNVRQALQKRGWFNEVLSREADGQIKIELKFRLQISGKMRLVTYFLSVGLNENGQAIVEREILRYKRGQYGSPFHFLDFAKGAGFAITNEEKFDIPDEELERENQTLDSADILAIKGLGQFQRFRAASEFRRFIESWHVSDFHISAARPSQEAGYAEHLSVTGNNLALVTQYMYEQHRDIFDSILQKMKKRVPGIQNVQAENTVDGRVVLKFSDEKFKDPFIARYVSDGTIKMFAYLLLLHDPRPHPMLCIEEPENQLYPLLMPHLTEELRDYEERGGQIFVSTHSPDILNAAEPDEVFWLSKKSGYTQIYRASEDPQINSLVEAGDKLGWLWKQEVFGGTDI
ncbi:MAG: chromosome segregation protein SMC [Desulfobacteraceae bacterium 4572_88]|nr:MAG: chromosome segregation protein SMC [Desulfobacteraceae bacterium 4572_88]